VTGPQPLVTPHPHSPPPCLSQPLATIDGARLSRHGIRAHGIAVEKICPGAGARSLRLARVVRVYVIVYHRLEPGRCRFVTTAGKLSRARSCTRPIQLGARGTGHWTLRRRLNIPAGRYIVQAVGVDGLGHRQVLFGGGAVVARRVR
jgi:hypothetical protein